VDRIDYLVLTHPHPDHLQGVKAVAEELRIGEFWESGQNVGEEYQKLKDLLQLHKVPVRVLNRTSAGIQISGILIRCLYPFAGENAGLLINDMNETSLVLHFDTGRLSALFTGDIGFATESRLIREKTALRSTLLKVPHHGSRYSTGNEFLTAVSPQVALIGAGYNNSFGLPARETLEQLSTQKISIYRTDLDGTISVTFPSDGKDLFVSAYKRQIH